MNCVNLVIRITLEALINQGVNNERARPAGYGQQSGRRMLNRIGCRGVHEGAEQGILGIHAGR